MKAYIYFDSSYAPCGFLIVKEGASPYSDKKGDTCLIQTDWDFPGVASRMGYVPCGKCGATDGTVNCCHKTVNQMINEAYEFIQEKEGELFEELSEYLIVD